MAPAFPYGVDPGMVKTEWSRILPAKRSLCPSSLGEECEKIGIPVRSLFT